MIQRNKCTVSVYDLLESFNSYLSQFQNWKDLRETVAKERGTEFVKRIEDRVAVLTAWINTIDDLNEKIALVLSMNDNLE